MNDDTPQNLARLDKVAIRVRNQRLFPLGKRYCRSCKRVKRLKHFARHWSKKGKKHYHDTVCKKCNNRVHSEYRKAHPDYAQRQVERTKQWRRGLTHEYHVTVWAKRKRRKFSQLCQVRGI